jgi:hypothetical protein
MLFSASVVDKKCTEMRAATTGRNDKIVNCAGQAQGIPSLGEVSRQSDQIPTLAPVELMTVMLVNASRIALKGAGCDGANHFVNCA